MEATAETESSEAGPSSAASSSDERPELQPKSWQEAEFLDLAMRINPSLTDPQKALVLSIARMKLAAELENEAKNMFALTDRLSPDLDKIELVVVPQQTRDRLFSGALETARERSQRGTELIAMMHNLCPEVAENFAPKSVALEQAPFRLLCPKKDSESGNSSAGAEVPSYIALSYCWHNDDWKRASGAVQKTKWPIADIMIQGLFASRESPDEGIWIDQYCINQEDEEEKALAIGSMDIIYASARRIIVVLEDVELQWLEEKALYMARHKESEDPSWRPAPMEEYTIAFALYKIMSSRWFDRAWCFHEFRVGYSQPEWKNRFKFLAYSKRGYLVDVPITLLLTAARVASQKLLHLSLVGATADQPPQVDWKVVRRFMSLIDRNRSGPWNNAGTRSSPLSEYEYVVDRQCSVVGDRLAVAVNLCGLGVFYKGRIKTDAEAYWLFTAMTLALGDASILNLSGPGFLIRTLQDGARLFSWANSVDFFTRMPLFLKDTFIYRFNTEEIELDVLFLKGQISDPGKENLHLAGQFVQRCKDNGLKIFGDTAHLRGEHDLTEDQGWYRFTSIVACVLEGGIEWARMAAHIVPSSFRGGERAEGGFPGPDRYKQPALETIFAEFHQPGNVEPEDLVRFICYLSESSILGSAESFQCLTLGQSGNLAIVGSGLEKHMLAIPRCFADTVDFTRSVWVLEASELIPSADSSLSERKDASITKSDRSDTAPPLANSKWRLIRKMPFICGGNLADNEGSVQAAERVVIAGPMRRS